MFSAVEWMIAKRYLRTKRKESFIAVIVSFSLLGIALGVAALIVVTSVMNGVREEMLRHFVGLSGHIQLYHQSGKISDYTALAKEIAATPGVAQTTPLIQDQVMVSAGRKARGAQVRAIPPEGVKDFEYLKARMVDGSWEAFTRGEGLLLGDRLARHLKVSAGDSITVISPEGRQTVVGLVPRLKAYPVAGTFRFGMHAIDASLIVMPFEDAQRYFKLSNEGEGFVNGMEIRLDELDKAAATADQLNQTLGREFYAVSWERSNAAVFEALNVQRAVMFLILTLIILVAVFNIISSLIMLVKDKQRDIAILRSMGMTRDQIQRIFILCGTIIGGIGTGLGLGLGLLIAHNVDNIRLWFEAVTGQPLLGEQLYFLANLPAEVDPAEVMAIVGMAMFFSLLSTLYPARRAAKQDPAEALRYE
jgi:lipoprotein-releasing system permease protein